MFQRTKRLFTSASKSVLLFVICAVLYLFFVGPALISAHSTILVVIGAILGLLLIGWLFRSFVRPKGNTP